MKSTTVRSESGIAIIIVMVSIFVLAVLVGGFAYSMKVETKLAMNSNNESQLLDARGPGIDYCRMLLSLEISKSISGQRYDSLDQKWNHGSSETNQAILAIQDSDISLGPQVTIRKWFITDTERKFNVNLALNNPAVLQNALIHAGIDASDVASVIACLQDWIDRDDDTHVGGAETEYYQTLVPPYVAKNGPIDDISELQMIKPFYEHPELLLGAEVTNRTPTIFQPRIVTRDGVQAVAASSDVIKLTDVFTPISNGQINILTASASQLRVLPNVDETVADQIVQLRQELGQDQLLPYRTPSDLLFNTPLGRDLTQQIAPYCTFRSTTFIITVVVDVGMSTRTYFALVRRNSPKDIPILQFRWADGDQSAAAAVSPNNLTTPLN